MSEYKTSELRGQDALALAELIYDIYIEKGEFRRVTVKMLSTIANTHARLN